MIISKAMIESTLPSDEEIHFHFMLYRCLKN